MSCPQPAEYLEPPTITLGTPQRSTPSDSPALNFSADQVSKILAGLFGFLADTKTEYREAAAEFLSVNVRTIYAWEAGDERPHANILKRFFDRRAAVYRDGVDPETGDVRPQFNQRDDWSRFVIAERILMKYAESEMVRAGDPEWSKSIARMLHPEPPPVQPAPLMIRPGLTLDGCQVDPNNAPP